MKNWLFVIARWFYGLLFIASAITKLFPWEAFELVLIKQIGVSWAWAPLLARLLIVVEFGLGACILFGFQTKKMVYASLVMLAAFTAHLAFLTITGEGGENCGCFGELIPMDAPTSMGKNLVFAGLGLFLLWKFEAINKRSFGWGGLVSAYFFIPVLFAFVPLPEGELSKEATLGSEVMAEVNEELPWDLDKGEKVVLVMYSKCVHCAQLASLISTADLELADEKLRMLISGPEQSLTYFLEKTSTSEFPMKHCSNRSLMQAINGTVPVVILMQDGEVVSNWTGAEVNINLLVNVMNGMAERKAE